MLKKPTLVNSSIQEGNPIALIYCRVNERNDDRIGEQADVCVDYCEEKDIEVYGTAMDNGFSGASFDRPGFRKIMEVITNQGKGDIPYIDYLVCEYPSTFSRSTDLAEVLTQIEEIRKYGTELVYTVSPQEMQGVMASVMKEFELYYVNQAKSIEDVLS